MDPFSIGFGILSAGSSILGGIGQHQSQTASINAQNAASKAQHEHKLKIRENNWAGASAEYKNKINDYQSQRNENHYAANQAYVSQQLKLNEIYKASSLRDQNAAIKQAQAMGNIRASGQAGRSIKRLAVMSEAMFGRNQAINTESLQSAQFGYERSSEATRRSLMMADKQAYAQIRNTPFPDAAPLAPTMFAGPSSLGLLSSIGGGITSGVGAAMQAHKGEWFV